MRKALFIMVCSVFVMSAVKADDFSDSYKRAKSAAQSGDYRTAVSLWKSSLKIEGLSANQKARTYFSLAKAYKLNDNQEKALAYAKRTEQLLPGNSKVIDLIEALGGEVIQPEMSFKEAKESFKDGLLNERMYEGTGESLLKDSAEVFGRTINEEDNAAYSHYALGTIELIIGSEAKALTHLKKSLELDGSNPDAHHRLAEVYMERDNSDFALEHMKLYKKYGGSTIEGSAALVKAYGLSGEKVNSNEIVALVTEVAAKNPDMAAPLANYFKDTSLIKSMEQAVSKARSSANQRASTSSSRGNSSSRNSSDSSKSGTKRKQAEKKEKERTPVEKNYDKYNENRYRQYIQHLGRVSSGSPSVWSGAIPKRPEKKDKKK